MKRYVKLAGSTLSGLAISLALYYFFIYGVLDTLRSRSGRSPDPPEPNLDAPQDFKEEKCVPAGRLT